MGEEDASLGFLKLEIKFEAPPKGDKTVGILHVNIREGRNLVPTSAGGTADPYVKLYLSKDGKDLKTTKQKTAHQRATVDPLFEERLVVYLAHGITLDEAYRLQITVWDNGGRLATNECMGGLSFSLGELASAPIAGWFMLLPEPQCRAMNEPVQGPVGETFSLQRSGSTRSLSIAPKGFRRMTGSFRKSISKLTGKEGHGGSMMDLSSAGTSKKSKDKDSSSMAGSPSSVRRFSLLSKKSKEKEKDEPEPSMASRFARKGDTAPAPAPAPAPAAAAADDDEEDDGPRDFGGRVVRAAPVAAAAADDDEEIFIDDDGPGDLGAKATRAAPPAAAPADAPATNGDDDDDDDDRPRDFGGRVVRPALVAVPDDEDGRQTPDGVPDEEPAAAPVLKLAQPAPPTDDADGDEDPEGQLPGLQPQSYHGSSSSIDRLGASATRAVPTLTVSMPSVPAKASPLSARSDALAPAPTPAPAPSTFARASSQPTPAPAPAPAPISAAAPAPISAAAPAARKESASAVPVSEPGGGRRMSASLRAASESTSSIATKASRDAPAKEPAATSSRLTKEPSATALQSRAAKEKDAENGHTSRTPDEQDRPEETSLRRKKMPQPSAGRRASATSAATASSTTAATAPAAAAAADDGRAAQLEAEVASLRQREQDLQHRVAALEEELQAQTASAEAARSELDSAQAKGKDPKRDLDKLQQLTKVQEEVRRLRGEAREAREQRDQALQAQKALEDKMDQLVKSQEALKLAGLEQINSKLSKQIEATASKADDLEEENRELRHYIDRLLVQLLALDPKAIERAALPGQ